MCLDIVHSKKSKKYPVPKTGWMWKRFSTVTPTYVITSVWGMRLERGVWVKSNGATWNERYPFGFHGYVNNPNYRSAKTIEVKFRKGHTRGVQDDKEVIVAKEIFIPLPEPKKKGIKK